MSDQIPLVKQRQCADLNCKDEKYIVDIFSYVQPERYGHNESRKQLFVYITRAEENNRSEFLQEEKSRLGMIKVYSDKFCWSRTQEAGTLITKLEMGDFSAVGKIERRKIDEMRLPEKVTYTLPSCDASAMKIAAKLLSGSLDGQTLLETEQLNVELSMIPQCETKQAVEHEHETSQPTEQSLDPEEQIMA